MCVCVWGGGLATRAYNKSSHLYKKVQGNLVRICRHFQILMHIPIIVFEATLNMMQNVES